MSEKVYRWECDFGRHGNLVGLFVADSDAVAAAIGKTAVFYEALGKHSCPQTELEQNQFSISSEEPALISFLKEKGPTGYNPLDYVNLTCADCHYFMNPEEVVTFRCETCSVDLCETCSEAEAHRGHETTASE